MVIRRFMVLSIVLAGTLVGVKLIARGEAPPPSDGNLLAEAQPLWPADRAWTWSFHIPKEIAKGEGLALRFRSKSSTVPVNADNSSEIQSPKGLMSATDAQHESGSGVFVVDGMFPPADSGTVSVQLLDLSDVGIAPTMAGANLRVLANCKVGMGGFGMSNETIPLPSGGHFIQNSAVNDPRWFGKEMYLMNFLVRNGNELIEYDIFLERATQISNH
jgi:hypothetical protein